MALQRPSLGNHPVRGAGSNGCRVGGLWDSGQSAGWVAAAVGDVLVRHARFPGLLINLWEETAWAGFAQSRLMARHGLMVGSLLTAVPFAAIHIPMQFWGDGGCPRSA